VALARVRKRFILSIALSFFALLAVLHPGPGRAQNADQSVWPTRGWLTSTPEEQGMDSAALAKLVAYGERHDGANIVPRCGIASHRARASDPRFGP
jgi:hypothetical protein